MSVVGSLPRLCNQRFLLAPPRSHTQCVWVHIDTPQEGQCSLDEDSIRLVYCSSGQVIRYKTPFALPHGRGDSRFLRCNSEVAFLVEVQCPCRLASYSILPFFRLIEESERLRSSSKAYTPVPALHGSALSRTARLRERPVHPASLSIPRGLRYQLLATSTIESKT